MGKWTEMLLNRASIKTDPGGNTVKTSQRIPDDVQKLQQSDSFDGFDGNFYGACFENTPHAETIVERAAIMEHDGELPRDHANRLASEAYDRQRQQYENVNPDGNPRIVEGLYRNYIQHWKPTGDDTLPATPPNTQNNAELWRAWWKQVEGNK